MAISNRPSRPARPAPSGSDPSVQLLLEMALGWSGGRWGAVALRRADAGYVWAAAVDLPTGWDAQLDGRSGAVGQGLDQAQACAGPWEAADPAAGAYTVVPVGGWGAAWLGGPARPLHDQARLAEFGRALAQIWNTCQAPAPAGPNPAARLAPETARSSPVLRALFQGIPHPIYIVDSAYRLIELNDECRHLGGGLPSNSSAPDPITSLRGAVCHAALFGRAEPCVGCQAAQALRTGSRGRRTERRWGADDQITEWDQDAYPILGEGGRPEWVLVFSQEMTETRRLEASLAQSEKLAAVGQLAAGVAHEINNPLAAIVANTQLLQRELDAADARQESVELIARAGDRVMQVVRGLLDFARQERYEFAPTDVNQSLENALALARPLLRGPVLRLRLNLAADLPRIQANQDHLQGVWLNLLLNARDSLPEGGGEISVTTCLLGPELQVQITDTGVGIRPERLPRIFEPFFTTKEAGRGTGLGLYTSQRIVTQHGGQIRVESQVGQGTAFTVLLPVPAAPAA